MSLLNNVRIYFAPCGIGMGHVSRSYHIAQKSVEQGAKVFFSTYLEAVNYIRRYGLPVASSPEISLKNDPMGSIDLKLSTITTGLSAIPTFKNQVKIELFYQKSYKPDLVFSDTRLSSIIAAKLLRIPTILMLNQYLPRIPRNENSVKFRVADGAIMTLLGRSWNLSSKIIIPDFPDPYTISIDSLRIPDRYKNKIHFVGPILSQNPKEVTGMKVREQLDIKSDQKLVFAAISGPKPEREPLLKLLEPMFKDFPDEYKIVMSLGRPEEKSKIIKNGNLIKIPWIENRWEYLKACDIVISRAGHETIMQSIGYSKPSLIIPVPNHPEQYGNARRTKELGIADAIHQRDLSKVLLLDKISSILQGDIQRTLDVWSSSNIISNGLEKIQGLIKEIIL